MTDITYDPEADAVYITVGKGEFDHTEEAGPFVYDVSHDGRVLGIEILGATRLLAPGAGNRPDCPARRATRPNSK
jgi:uncharacterized protein YuzE